MKKVEKENKTTKEVVKSTKFANTFTVLEETEI